MTSEHQPVRRLGICVRDPRQDNLINVLTFDRLDTLLAMQMIFLGCSMPTSAYW
jgi:hypothetical protein